MLLRGSRCSCRRFSAAGAAGAPVTVGSALRAAADELRAAGVPEARLSARYLLEGAVRGGAAPASDGGGGAGGRLPLDPRAPVPRAALARLAGLCRLRRGRWPVQYLLGEWDFHGVNLLLRPPVLVPRPETEELVELVLPALRQALRARASASGGAAGPLRLLDVGCGSGAIGLALLAALRRLPHGGGADVAVECTAIDCLPAAVALSRRNAARLGFSAGHGAHPSSSPPPTLPPLPALPAELAAVVGDADTFGEGQQEEEEQQLARAGRSGAGRRCTYACEALSLREFGARHAAAGAPPFDFVLSNPPYIPSAAVRGLQPEVLRFESALALDGGADGLDMVEELLRLAPALLRPAAAAADAGGGELPGGELPGGELWMEVDEAHPAQLARWFEEGRAECVRGLCLIACKEDMSARPRFVGVGVEGAAAAAAVAAAGGKSSCES